MIDTEERAGTPNGAAGSATSVRGGRRRKKGPSCESCFFGCRGLCALDLGGPCATFRPDSPDGLMPPRQPALLIRESEAFAAAS